MTFTQSPWSLSDLFPGIDSPELDLSFKHLEAQVAEFEEFRAELMAEMPTDKFLNVVRESEKIMRAGYRVYGFASLSFAANTQDQAAQALMGRVQQFFAELQNRILFFSLWWKDLDDQNATRLMDASGDYHYYLEEMRHYKPHTLSEPEEKIVNIKNVSGIEALTNLYDSITKTRHPAGGPQPGKRYSQRCRRYAARSGAQKCAGFPALFQGQGQTAWHGQAAPLRCLRPGQQIRKIV